MRPTYETRDDRARQYKTLVILCDYFDCTFKETTQESKYPYDAVLIKDGVTRCICEVKVRTCAFADHPVYIIAETKVAKLCRIATKHPVRAIFAFRWTDKVGWLCADKIERLLTPRQGGRKDRGDPRDIESVYYVPVNMFNLLR
jgi:hypothetical protein